MRPEPPPPKDGPVVEGIEKIEELAVPPIADEQPHEFFDLWDVPEL